MEILAADWVLPVDSQPIERGAVALEGGRIVAVAPADELGRADATFAEAAIVPGFVNAHSHLEYAVYAGFGDGLPFAPWLALHIDRKHVIRERFEDMVAIARAGAADCLRSGVTTVADASYSGAAAIACAELGLRATVYVEVFKTDADAALERFDEVRARIEHVLSDRIRLGISPHAPYTTSNEVYARCLELGLPVATHLSESQAELDWLVRGEGPMEGLVAAEPCGVSGIRRLAAAGLLSPRMIAAHCVCLDGEEIELLARHGVAVAHCPRSNAVLGCGIAPLRELLQAGVRVGLGTDSPASTPSFDFFEEIRTAVYVARARARRGDALGAGQALELATLGSARALELEHEIGSLTPGKRADLAVVSLAGSPYVPWEEPAPAVVFGGSPERVLLTLVEGKTRYEKGVTDWHELTDAASSVRARMLAGAGPPAHRVAEPT